MFEIGDKVRVERKAPSISIWVTSMDRTIGSVGEVVEIEDTRNLGRGVRYCVYFENIQDRWWYESGSLVPPSEPSSVPEPGAYLAILKSLKK